MAEGKRPRQHAGVGERHQRDADGADREVAEIGGPDIGHRERRQPAGQRANDGHVPAGGEVEQPHDERRPDHIDQHPGHTRQNRLITRMTASPEHR